MAEFINVQRDNGTSVDQAERDHIPDWQSAAGANYRERPRPRLDWRVSLLIVLFLGSTFVYLLIRFMQFLTDVSYRTSWLDVWLIGAFKVGLFLTPIATLLLGLYWLYGAARARNVIRLQNNMPVTLRHVEQDAWAGVAVGSLNAFYQVQNTWAAHSDYRSLNQLDLSSSGAAKVSDAPALPVSETPLPLVPVSEWMQWVDRVPHVLLAAETGGGKSTTAKAILAPRLDAGESTFVIDPHSSAWFDLPGVGGGENWHEVRAAMDAVVKEYKARMDERDAYLKATGNELPPEHFPRLNVLLDEGNLTHDKLNVAKRGEQSPWERFIITMGSGARKVRISIILLCQSANVEDLDISGPMRRNFTRIALDSSAARKLIDVDAKDPAHKKALHATLVNNAYPAVCEYRGVIYVLDRTGLDRVPAPVSAVRCAWEVGYTSVREQVARTNQNVPFSTDGRTDQFDRRPPVKLSDQQRLDALTALRRQGVKREDAREVYGLVFENDDWTRAGEAI